MNISIIGKAVFIKSEDYNFMYDKEMSNCEKANDINEVYRYYGGLRCNYEDSSEEYKELEQSLCMMANSVLKKKIIL
jgi:hypothetical protein